MACDRRMKSFRIEGANASKAGPAGQIPRVEMDLFVNGARVGQVLGFWRRLRPGRGVPRQACWVNRLSLECFLDVYFKIAAASEDQVSTPGMFAVVSSDRFTAAIVAANCIYLVCIISHRARYAQQVRVLMCVRRAEKSDSVDPVRKETISLDLSIT